jgi:hypothetical protein
MTNSAGDAEAIVVRVMKFWDDLDLLRQTPGHSGMWRGIRFVLDGGGDADYVVIHGHVGTRFRVQCPRENVWLLLGEPPNEQFTSWHDAPGWVGRIYTTDATRKSPRHFLRHPGLPWHVNRDFDFLSQCPPPAKTGDLSWITSNRVDTEGHRKRMAYLERIKSMPSLDLFGRGFNPLDDKWDGLLPYRYSIAFENYVNSHYWTEKLMDCYLAWTVPLYYGCTELEKFFPPESFIRIDPSVADPIGALQQIIKNDEWERRLSAIKMARELVLHDHNFFELIAREVEAREAIVPAKSLRKRTFTVVSHTGFLSTLQTRLPPRVLRAAAKMKGLIK